MQRHRRIRCQRRPSRRLAAPLAISWESAGPTRTTRTDYHTGFAGQYSARWPGCACFYFHTVVDGGLSPPPDYYKARPAATRRRGAAVSHAVHARTFAYMLPPNATTRPRAPSIPRYLPPPYPHKSPSRSSPRDSLLPSRLLCSANFGAASTFSTSVSPLGVLKIDTSPTVSHAKSLLLTRPVCGPSDYRVPRATKNREISPYGDCYVGNEGARGRKLRDTSICGLMCE